MLNMEWHEFCKHTQPCVVVVCCFGTANDPTYLNWIFKA